MRRMWWCGLLGGMVFGVACDDEDPADGAADTGVDTTPETGEETGDTGGNDAADAVEEGGGGTVLVVSELPMTSEFPEGPESVRNAILQAIEDNDGAACGGQWVIEFESRDHTNPESQVWDAETAAANAETNVADTTISAVIGTYNSGAAYAMIPIYNEAGLVMISPANTYPGLTVSTGAEPGDPDVLYENGPRNYARLAGPDHLQGAAAVQWAADLEATTVFLVGDGEIYGDTLVDIFAGAAEAAELSIAGQESLADRADDIAALADEIVTADPSLVYYGGIAELLAPVIEAVYDGGYRGIVMGPDGLFSSGLVAELGDKIEGLYVTLSGVPPDALTGAAATWRDSYENVFGGPPEAYAAEGYAATQVLFAAFEEVCANGGALTDRAAVRDAVMASENVETILGPITFDENGDTTTPVMSGFQIIDGEFEFQRTINLD